MAIETIQLGKILITHKGAWSSAVAYEALDVVSYIGSSYLALTAPPMGTLVTNATYWRPLSKSAYQYAVEAGYTGTEEEFGILIDSIQDKVDKDAIVNTLTETTAGKVLDARQGKALNDAKINKDGSNSAIETLTFIGVTDADVPIELPVEYSKDDGTYNFTLPSGAVGQLFQELYFHAKTTEAITEGDAIQYAGAQGRHALIKKAVPAEIKVNPYLFMGVATTSAANNAFCKVTWFGNVSGVSTTGWSLGNILYYDSANVSAGKLTNTMPVAPNTRINVGVVTLLSTGGAANGTILVRPEFHNNLVDSDDVYAPALATGDVLKWNDTAKRFEVFNIDTALEIKAAHGYDSNPKTLKQVDDSLVQLAGEVNEKIYKTLNVGAAGLVTIKPTTSYYTYKLNVLGNVTINIDLLKMIQQVGNARCRLIIDMPIVRTITITKPLLWGGTAPTFSAAGQYIFEIIDVDGTNTPLIWQVANTTKVQATGNILFVDSTGADYSVEQINAGTPTRTTSSWISPFKYLQNAINVAQAGDIIFVKQGIYKPTHLRTTPTVYVDGDRLNRNATFTPKNGVDIYGGFLGTETKTWQRVMDANGYPVNKTILCGDIAGEATVDPAKTVGDTRTDASKANQAFNVVFGKAISALTYLNGVNVRYGNASEATGDQGLGGIYSAALLIGINNTAYNNTARSGGGWIYGANTNCTAYSNTSTNGGGWFGGANTNCTAYGNTASYGGGWAYATTTNCTAYGNTASYGGGWAYATTTNCTAYGNTASYGGGWAYTTTTNCTAYSNTSTNGGGWFGGTNTNCTAYSNTSTNGGGWVGGTNTNCTAYSNTATYGGGWFGGANTNCTGVNNKAEIAVSGSEDTDTNINCLLYNNKTAAGIATGFQSNAATGVRIFRNNAYDVAHPTITGGAGSDINTATCIANLTAEQAKIDVPTFIGAATTLEQLAELHAYAATITTKLKPKDGSVLKGAGVNNTTYPNPTDCAGTERPEASTIGILEGE